MGDDNRIPLQDALEEYCSIFFGSRNLAPRTRLEYRNDLEDLLRYLQQRCFVFLADRVEHNHLEGYLAELDRRGFSGNTRRRHYASLRSFFSFLEQSGAIRTDPSRR